MPLLPRVGEEATHVFLLHIIGDLTLQFVPSGTMKEQTGPDRGQPLTPEDTIQDLLNHRAFTSGAVAHDALLRITAPSRSGSA